MDSKHTKTGKTGCLIATLLPLFLILVLAAPWLVGGWMNDRRARAMEKELVEYYTAQGVTVVESDSLTGHAGYGSQVKVDIWAGVLLFTQDPLSFEATYPDLHSVGKDGAYTEDMQWVSASFSTQVADDKAQYYYIDDRLGTPFTTYFDIRGH